MDEKRNDPIIEAEQNTGAEENELVLTLKKPTESMSSPKNSQRTGSS